MIQFPKIDKDANINDYLDNLDKQIKGWRMLGAASMFGLAGAILVIIIMVLFF